MWAVLLCGGISGGVDHLTSIESCMQVMDSYRMRMKMVLEWAKVEV